MKRDDMFFMNQALKQAKIAAQIKEVPVGAVIVRNNKIISEAFNKKEILNDPTAHAEIIAIKLACLKLQNWRLLNCEIFVTLQPCLMCLEAIKNARISKLIFAASRPERKIIDENNLINKIEIKCGLLEFESNRLLTNFFKKLR